jgi:16S rRNA (guanine966-N2)-methyltransferase
MLKGVRIIAGEFRSRTLKAPPGMATRPTSDRLRETIFNVLAPRIRGAVFMDLYAGSGAVGIEALSRGAAEVVFVERAPAALRILNSNLAGLGITCRFRVDASAVSPALRRMRVESPFDLVYLDPPFDLEAEYASSLGLLGGECARLLAPSALVIAEHRPKSSLEEQYGVLQRTRLLKQGDAALSFYSATSEP